MGCASPHISITGDLTWDNNGGTYSSYTLKPCTSIITSSLLLLIWIKCSIFSFYFCSWQTFDCHISLTFKLEQRLWTWNSLIIATPAKIPYMHVKLSPLSLHIYIYMVPIIFSIKCKKHRNQANKTTHSK